MCIEVAADDGTRILLDLGMPLQAPAGGDSCRARRALATGRRPHVQADGERSTPPVAGR